MQGWPLLSAEIWNNVFDLGSSIQNVYQKAKTKQELEMQLWDEKLLYGKNHDVSSTGLPADTLRGFTNLNNTLDQHDLRALDLYVRVLCWIEKAPNVNIRQKKRSKQEHVTSQGPKKHHIKSTESV